MRHQRLRHTLGLRTEEREALLVGLAEALARRGRIETTVEKAKAAQPFVERLITLAKGNTLHTRRQLISRLRSSKVADVFMNDIVPSVNGRTSGYTRIIRYKHRIGDGAETAILEFTDPIKRGAVPTGKKEKKKLKVERGLEEEAKKRAKKQKQEKKRAEKTTVSAPAVEGEEVGLGEAEVSKEKPKKGGFLAGLRKFLKGEE